jgi:hypothetical protein
MRASPSTDGLRNIANPLIEESGQRLKAELQSIGFRASHRQTGQNSKIGVVNFRIADNPGRMKIRLYF